MTSLRDSLCDKQECTEGHNKGSKGIPKTTRGPGLQSQAGASQDTPRSNDFDQEPRQQLSRASQPIWKEAEREQRKRLFRAAGLCPVPFAWPPPDILPAHGHQPFLSMVSVEETVGVLAAQHCPSYRKPQVVQHKASSAQAKDSQIPMSTLGSAISYHPEAEGFCLKHYSGTQCLFFEEAL